MTRNNEIAFDRPITELPDGSGCFTGSLPLPKNHWIYETDEHGFTGSPPMLLRMVSGQTKEKLIYMVTQAGKYAIKASTRCGKENDFDPDAMLQNLIVGLFGYHTPDGLSGEDWDRPNPVPPLHDVKIEEVPIKSIDSLATDHTSPTGVIIADEPAFKNMPNPTEHDLADPRFEAIWQVIKKWDVNAPDHYQGYCGANGSHVMMILNNLRNIFTGV